MTIETVRSDKQSLSDALAQKRQNVDNLCRLLLATPASAMQMARLTVTNFQSATKKLITDRRFKRQILPAVTSGDFSGYETLSPRPDPEILNWAAERLVPERQQLGVRNAQSWNEFILSLFCSEGAVLRDEIAPAERQALDHQFELWKRDNPAIARPIFREQPTPTSIAALYRFFLGRSPNKNDDVAARIRQGYPTTCRQLMRSLEFQRNFLAWLGGQESSHQKKASSAASETRDILTRLFDWQNDKLETDSLVAPDWPEVLEQIWSDPGCRADILGLLSDPTDPIDSFTCALVEDAMAQISAQKPLLAAHYQSSYVLVMFEVAEAHAPALIEVNIIGHENGQILASEAIEDCPSGRHTVRLPIDLSTISETDPSEFYARLSGPNSLATLQVKRRPTIGQSGPIAAKIAWHWGRGETEKAASLLLDLDAAGDDGTAFFMERLHNKITGDRAAAPTLVSRRSQDWQHVSDVIAARQAGMDADFSPSEQLRSWFDKSEARRAVFDWLTANPGAKSPLTQLIALAASEAPDSQFRDICERFKTPEALASALAALAMTDMDDRYLAMAVGSVSNLSPTMIRSECSRDHNAIALGGLTFAASLLEPELAARLGLLIGAAKYAENSGKYKNAIELTGYNARGDNPDLGALILAGTMANKYGNAVDAAEYFRRASDKKPNDVALNEKYLNVERGLVMADPLRADREFVNRSRRFRDRCVKALIKRPGDPELIFALAKSLLIEGNEVGATDVLSGLDSEGQLSPDARKLLVDLYVKRNDNESAIELCERIPPEELSEWVVINHARALRALGRAEEAGEVLERNARAEWSSVAREAIRNLFFLAEFDKAAERGEQLSAMQPEDIELRLICAAAYFETANVDAAERHVSAARHLPKAVRFQEELDLFEYAIARKRGDALAVRFLNPMFSRLGCSSLTTIGASAGSFDSFVLAANSQLEKTDYAPLTDGPLVSVIMTSYNSSAYIDTAISSILNQRYRNIELIVVDDKSDDDTPRKILDWQQLDSRVKPVLKTQNDGTYVSKNLGLLQALGEYVALQDSDDWSHPDRIGKSVSVLQSRSDLMALTTDWLRMTNEGGLMIKAGGQISHVCCISLVFRRAPVVDAIGFFDSVRIEADMEYIRRIQLAFGRRSLARLRWPLLFGRVRSDSLTGNEEFGISRTGFSPPRIEYQSHQAAWHDKIRAGASAFMPFPLEARVFEAPGIILPKRPEDQA